MADERQSVQLFDTILFPKIFRTFRMAIQPTKLIIAFLSLLVICLSGWLMDLSKTVVVTNGLQGKETELQIYVSAPEEIQSYLESSPGDGERTGVFAALWHFTAARFKGAVDSIFALNLPGVAGNIVDCFKAIRWALKFHFLYCIIFFLIVLAVISVGGGAICRIAALQFARGEKPGLTGSLRYSLKNFTSFFAAPLVPIVIVVCIGLFISVLGLICNIPRAGELIMAVFMFLALIAGALIAFFLIGTVAGFNLMFPAVAYDGSDCLDAISRSFNYVFSRPWQMGFYTAIAAVYGAVCYTFVRLFAFLLLFFTHRFLQLSIWVDNSSKTASKLIAIWPEPTFIRLIDPSSVAAGNLSESVAAFVVQLLLLAVVGLVVSFIISFYFSANTIIYSLLRNRVDNTALDDIYTPQFDQDSSGPTPTESLVL